MARTYVLATISLLVAVLNLRRGAPDAAPICVSSPLFPRDASLTQVLGVLAPDRIPAYQWPRDANAIRDDPPAKESGVVYARRFLVAVVEGTGASAIHGSGTSVFMVPWRTGDDCRRYAWTFTGFPIAEGDTTFVAATLRPREGWIRQTPTLDVDMFSVTYPQPEGRPPGRYMTARAMATAYAHFPTRQDWCRAPRTELDSLVAWARTRPDSEVADPVATLLQDLAQDVSRLERLGTGACR